MKATWPLGLQKIGLQATSVLLATAACANAISFSIHGRQRTPESSLMKRMVNMTGSSNNLGNGSATVSDFGDIRYATNITLGGTVFEVSIDTGSTDLWVVGDVSETKNLTIQSNLTYGAGAAVGYINTAELVFDSFTIPDQAYLHAVQADEFPATLLNTSLADPVGILGLGPSSNSLNHILLNGTRGDPVLDRIFRQNVSTPNFISILLPREADDSDFLTGDRVAQTGQLTIGEVVPGLEAINNATRLPALADLFLNGKEIAFHWTTLLDSNGVIGPDGERIQTPTGIKNPMNGSSDQLHVIFDTGFSFPQIPRYLADAIYGRIPGAEFQANDQGTGVWQLPCTYELNVTFIFGGVEFPISPLDLNAVFESDEDGNPTTCGAAFQQTAANIADPNGGFGALDAILGQAFLRNVYLLINFGDFVDGSNSSVADPFIQLLSTTNTSSAHLDFVNQRLGGVDTTGSQPSLLPVDQGQHSPGGNSTNSTNTDGTNTNSTSTDGANTNSTSGSDIVSDSKSVASNELIGDDSTDDNDDDGRFYQKTWFIIMVSVLGALVLGTILFSITGCLRSRRSKVKSEAIFVPQLVGSSAYRPLTGERSVPGYSKHDTAWQGGYDGPQYGNSEKYGV